MKNSEKFEKAFNYFKKSYAYKMGGTQTVVLPNGKSKSFDDRQYYSGRGAKYNNSVKHDALGIVKVSKKEYSAFLEYLKIEKQRLNEIAERRANYFESVTGWDNILKVAEARLNVVGRIRGNNLRDWNEAYGWDEKPVSEIAHMGEFYLQKEDNPYNGCGVYRVGWKHGKMTCSLYGGYHNSCPEGISLTDWKKAVDQVVAKYADHFIKMDGSGCEFFFRDFEDADKVTIATEVYFVPDRNGMPHLNIQAAEAMVVSNQISC